VNLFESIHSHHDLIALSDAQRIQLCQEIRQFLVSSVSQTGGHLASNLGVVELSVAIETVFNTMEDRLVFDVGHQSYVHKLLTGRRAAFSSLRQFGGIAGFPKPSESDADAFVAGHASSSVSIALGMARARTLQTEKYNIIALIGDGAATGGMAYEGLNDAAVSGEPMIVILNDNAMSIDRNVGGMAFHLSRLRTKESYLGMKQRYRTLMAKIPGGKTVYRITRKIKDRIRRALIPTTIFENMGMTYMGPVDGHDVNNLIFLLKAARDMKRPVLLHVMTQKGHGYVPAERSPSRFHGVGKFDPDTGSILTSKGKSFSDVFGETLCELAAENSRVCAITAAMPGGTGLMPFKARYPKRLFDVGIAEEHAVSMAGGLAKQGMIPVVALYSTFLQRAYDMIFQDIAMLGLHVVFAVDRAGMVGEDGETHHGVYDLGFLRQVPGMRILCPGSCNELRDMLTWAVNDQQGPVAIRYPRGGDRVDIPSAWSKENSSAVYHRYGSDLTIVTYGMLIDNAIKAADLLAQQGVEVSVLRLLEMSDASLAGAAEMLTETTSVLVMEEVCTGSGIREAFAWALYQQGKRNKVFGIDLGANFVPHGDIQTLYKQYKLDAQSVCDYILEVVRGENKKTS